MSAITQIQLAPTKILQRDAANTIASEVVRQCRQQCGKALRAILLTGSLAREEATVLAEEGSCRILGDAEFLLVFRRDWARPAPAKLQALEEAVSQSLFSKGFQCRVHLAGVSPSYLRRLPAHIFSYELRSAGKVVMGNAGVKAAIPEIDARQIEREDGWRLLSNRMIEWLESLAAAASDLEAPDLGIFYATVKLWMDTATSLLVFLREFEPGYQARAMRLARLVQAPPATPLPFSLWELSRGVKAATSWKLAPDPAAARRLGWEFCDQARRLAGLLWCWEAARLTGIEEAAAPLAHLYSSRRKTGDWRGWLRAARECNHTHRRRPWRRWLALSRRGSPRWCVYAVAAECLLRANDFGLGAKDDLLSQLHAARLRQFLPLPTPSPGSGARDGWRELASELAWNYHHLVERTRA